MMVWFLSNMTVFVAKIGKTALAAKQANSFDIILERETDRQTNSLTPYTGYADFFFQLHFQPPVVTQLVIESLMLNYSC